MGFWIFLFAQLFDSLMLNVLRHIVQGIYKVGPYMPSCNDDKNSSTEKIRPKYCKGYLRKTRKMVTKTVLCKLPGSVLVMRVLNQLMCKMLLAALCIQ